MRVVGPAAASLVLAIGLSGCGDRPGGPTYDASSLRVAYAVSGALFTMDGRGARRSGPGGPASTPAWSPDGRRLAYFEWAGSNGESLYVDGLDGHRRAVKVARGRAAPDLTTAPPQAPLWSQDSESIAYVRRDANVEVVAADGSRTRTIRTRRLASDWYGLALVWAPDGARLAVIVQYGGKVGTWIADERGRLRRFAPGGAVVRDPAWSPDGMRIAFSHLDSRGNVQIVVAQTDGSRLAHITNDVPVEPHTNLSNHSPVWSPDGTRIAFLSNRDGIHSNELFVVRADGTGQRRLTRGASVRPQQAGFAGGRTPPAKWSPDGRMLAFLGWGWYTHGRLGLVDAEGGRPSKLVREPLEDGYQAPLDFAWQREGEPLEVSPAPPLRSIRPNRIRVEPDHLPPGQVRLERRHEVMRVAPDRDHPVWDSAVDVAPDASALSIVTQTPPYEIGVLELGTKTRRTLARAAAPSSLEAGGLFSPDGRRVLYRRGLELRTVDRFTGRTELVAARVGHAPFTWLHDGRVGYVDPTGRVRIVRPGQTPKASRIHLKAPFAYALSPDGEKVVVMRGCQTELVDLGNGKRKTLGVGLVPSTRSWAPDGSLLALERSGGAETWCAPPIGKRNGDLLVFDAGGREIGALTGTQEPSADGVSAAWTSDSRWLLATIRYGGSRPPPSPIYIFSASSHRVSRAAPPSDGWGQVFAASKTRAIFTRYDSSLAMVVSKARLR